MPEERRPYLLRGGSLKYSENEWGFVHWVLFDTVCGGSNRKAVCKTQYVPCNL
jgi:hypothetical protein